MKTIYSKNHILRNSKTELYGGELVKPLKDQSEWNLLLMQFKREILDQLLNQKI